MAKRRTGIFINDEELEREEGPRFDEKGNQVNVGQSQYGRVKRPAAQRPMDYQDRASVEFQKQRLSQVNAAHESLRATDPAVWQRLMRTDPTYAEEELNSRYVSLGLREPSPEGRVLGLETDMGVTPQDRAHGITSESLQRESSPADVISGLKGLRKNSALSRASDAPQQADPLAEAMFIREQAMREVERKNRAALQQQDAERRQVVEEAATAVERNPASGMETDATRARELVAAHIKDIGKNPLIAPQQKMADAAIARGFPLEDVLPQTKAREYRAWVARKEAAIETAKRKEQQEYESNLENRKKAADLADKLSVTRTRESQELRDQAGELRAQAEELRKKAAETRAVEDEARAVRAADLADKADARAEERLKLDKNKAARESESKAFDKKVKAAERINKYQADTPDPQEDPAVISQGVEIGVGLSPMTPDAAGALLDRSDTVLDDDKGLAEAVLTAPASIQDTVLRVPLDTVSLPPGADEAILTAGKNATGDLESRANAVAADYPDKQKEAVKRRFIQLAQAHTIDVLAEIKAEEATQFTEINENTSVVNVFDEAVGFDMSTDPFADENLANTLTGRRTGFDSSDPDQDTDAGLDITPSDADDIVKRKLRNLVGDNPAFERWWATERAASTSALSRTINGVATAIAQRQNEMQTTEFKAQQKRDQAQDDKAVAWVEQIEQGNIMAWDKELSKSDKSEIIASGNATAGRVWTEAEDAATVDEAIDKVYSEFSGDVVAKVMGPLIKLRNELAKREAAEEKEKARKWIDFFWEEGTIVPAEGEEATKPTTGRVFSPDTPPLYPDEDAFKRAIKSGELEDGQIVTVGKGDDDDKTFRVKSE